MNPETRNLKPQLRVGGFEGPLDLLLHLIRSHRVSIWEIPIAEVTGQYLDYLALLEALDLEIGGEFLLMAATLMEIKSRLLLPRPEPPPTPDEGGDPHAELVERLLAYERFQQVAEQLRSLEQETSRTFSRATPETWDGAVPLVELRAADLAGALSRMRRHQEPAGTPRERARIRREPLPLVERMERILEAARAAGGMPIRLFEFLAEDLGDAGRREAVVLFLAVLELLRRGQITAWQRPPDGEILVCIAAPKQVCSSL